MFEIQNTYSFNKDKLTDGFSYDYVTRTSQNQGILQQTGFVNEKNINNAGNWSLGLLQMDFFYRHKPWYAGQFVRKIIAKMKLSKNSVLYFTAILNKQKRGLLSVLVRDVDNKFLNTNVALPALKNGEIDFNAIDNFIAMIELERITKLQNYLLAADLKDYTLTAEEQQVLDDFESLDFKDFKVIDIFNVNNSKSILSRDIVADSGATPYLCASADNNAVSTYIAYDKQHIDTGNCVFIGGKTFVVTYQENDFYSNDSHNLILHLKNAEKSKTNQLYLATCVKKGLAHKYSWGDSISNRKIQKDVISLPVKDQKPDYTIMDTLISAIRKLVIKDVVLYTQAKTSQSDSNNASDQLCLL